MTSKLNIRDLFVEAGKQLRSEFEFIRKTNCHYGESGSEAEAILQNFLNNHLPKRFSAGSGIVIDTENNISSQTDVIVYDAYNSPVYRKGSNVLILPSDNVASVIEVKSKLSKSELKDAAAKISSVKKLRKTPINEADQPGTFSSTLITKTLGIVFAYDSVTSLKTLSLNLAEINEEYPWDEWIDMVVVLDKGIISYVFQMPYSMEVPGLIGGMEGDFPTPPFYVHLMADDSGDMALNRFFLYLMTHLTFFRRRSTLRIDSMLENQAKGLLVRPYQFGIDKKLHPADEYYSKGNLLPNVVFNLYRENRIIGQVGRIPWQDGAVITYAGPIAHQIVYAAFQRKLGQSFSPILIEHEGAKILLSPVVPLSEADFVEITQNLFVELPADLSAKIGKIDIERDNGDGELILERKPLK